MANVGWAGGASGSGAGGDGTQWNLIDTLANLQAMSPVVGQVGFPLYTQNCPYILRCEVAGTWEYFYKGVIRCVPPPAAATWSAYNSGSFADLGGAVRFTQPAEASGPWRGFYRARPSDPTVTPYWVEFGLSSPLLGSALTGSRQELSTGFTDGTGLAEMRIGGDPGGNSFIVSRWATAGGGAAGDDVLAAVALMGDAALFRLEEDATNRHFKFRHWFDSTWYELGSGFGRTVTITATSVGVFSRANDTDYTRPLDLWHYNSGAL